MSNTVCLSMLLLIAAVPGRLLAQDKEIERVHATVDVLEEIADLPEGGIPPSFLEDAHGLIILPNVIKAGLVVGGRHGRGVLMARDADGAWSMPVFVELTGGSIGWQIGAQATDLVLVLKTERSVDGILKSEFTLGADASVAAGPVGRQASAATDAELKAEIFSYSRSRGLFAGLALEGAVLKVDDGANASFYRTFDLTARTILEAPPPAPEAAEDLRAAVARYTGGQP